MANNLIQIKRTSVSGRVPNTSILQTGELALNMADGILYSSNGTAVFEIGANNTNINVTGNLTVKSIIANNSLGTAGQVLSSNGTVAYWSTAVGYAGSAGFTGSIGSTGFTGSVGYTGSQGSTGFTGSKGDLGYTGSIGPSAGSNNQILYKNSSNTLTGSDGLRYDGVSIKVNGNLESVYSNGDEGGEIYLEKPVTNTTLAAGVTIDVYQNKLRIFENAGTNRGAYIDLTAASTGVGSNLLAASTAGYTGSQGPIGYTGSKGDQGTTGFVGSQGGTGFTGSKGDQGFTGSQGNLGYTGSQGDQGTAGFVGSKGDLGYTGSQGPQGTFGGAAFDYTFNANTDNSDPGNGGLKFSNTNASQANTLYISENADNFQSVYNFLQTIDDSTSSIKGHFTVTEKANTNHYAMFAITGSHTHYTNYFGVPTTFLSGSNTFSNGLDIIITFARTGDIGDPGYTGSQGGTGYTGSSGFTGSIGFTGSQGGIGYSGSQGDKGDIGFTGSQGGTGYVGSKGDQGNLGYTGSQGDTGFTGSIGTTGYVGSKGDQGNAGFTGSQGSIGYTGSKGDQGNVGFTGSQGDLGYTGSTGFVGSQGIVGYTGSYGDLGYTGSTGSIGYTGSSGSANSTISSNSELFVSDGTTNAFTLSTTSYSNNTVMVTLNGLLLTPADHYGITGNTLSFVVTPANNDYIEVRKLTGYGLTGYTGSQGPSTMPMNFRTSSYVATANDNGGIISITTGGVTINSGVFSNGQNITIFNNSGSNQTITSNGVTMYLAGSATTGNRTLAQRGMCSVFCMDSSSSLFVIAGTGLT